MIQYTIEAKWGCYGQYLFHGQYESSKSLLSFAREYAQQKIAHHDHAEALVQLIQEAGGAWIAKVTVYIGYDRPYTEEHYRIWPVKPQTYKKEHSFFVKQ